MGETIQLRVQYLSQIDFKPFGQKINREKIDQEIEPAKGVFVIPCVGDIIIDDGDPELNFVEVKYRPFICERLERHLLTTQSFIPLRGSCGLIVLAPPTAGNVPILEETVAVIIDGSEGININRGTWHSAPFSISKVSHYIMAGRKGTLEDDLHLVDLKIELQTEFQIVL
jgi:ureidoglycolate lyase